MHRQSSESELYSDPTEQPEGQESGMRSERRLRQALHLPIILSGYTGAGKDTVSHAARQHAASTSSRSKFHHSHSRYTDRPMRPNEIQGGDGCFITPEEFDTLQTSGEFFHHYKKDAYGGVRYGFSLPVLQNELATRHTFVVGGEIDTSIGLKKALDDIAAKSRHGMKDVLHPIILFVNRPKEKIIEGIHSREAAESEKRKRIAHVEQHWEASPKALSDHTGRVELIWNHDVNAAARQVIQVVESEVSRQIRDMYGSSMDIK